MLVCPFLMTLGNNICTTFALSVIVSPMIKVWVGGLGEEGTRLELEVAFEEFGPVKNIWIAKNPPSFAFIEMEVNGFVQQYKTNDRKLT